MYTFVNETAGMSLLIIFIEPICMVAASSPYEPLVFIEEGSY